MGRRGRVVGVGGLSLGGQIALVAAAVLIALAILFHRLGVFPRR
jgi:hypothetical protein